MEEEIEVQSETEVTQPKQAGTHAHTHRMYMNRMSSIKA